MKGLFSYWNLNFPHFSISQLLVYKSMDNVLIIPNVELNGNKINVVNSTTHLGHILKDNIFKNDSSKCIRDFNIQSNSFLADLKNSTSHMRNYLFSKYCTSFYGSLFLPIYDNTMEDIYKAWRMAVRKVWRVPWTTHCDLLPHLAGVMPPKLSFAKNAISFAKLLLKSDNPVVKMVTGMGIYGYHSILGQNFKYLTVKYNLDSKTLIDDWNKLCQVQHEEIRLCDQIKELCYMRDTYQQHMLSRVEIKDLIDTLCTE